MGFQSEKLYNIESIWMEPCRTQVIGANKSPSSIGRTGRSFRRGRRWQARIYLKCQGHSLFDLYYIYIPGPRQGFSSPFKSSSSSSCDSLSPFALPLLGPPPPHGRRSPLYRRGSPDSWGHVTSPLLILSFLFFFYRFAPHLFFFPFLSY